MALVLIVRPKGLFSAVEAAGSLIDLASIDILSDGRLEVGLGAGYNPLDYSRSGIRQDPPKVRVDRMTEHVRVMKALFSAEPVTSFLLSAENSRIAPRAGAAGPAHHQPALPELAVANDQQVAFEVVGIGNSLIMPAVVIRPILFAICSVNQRFPSGPTAIDEGPLAAVGIGCMAVGWPASIAGVVLQVVGAVIVLRAVWSWERTRVVITTEKLFIVHGTLRRRAAAVRLARLGAIEIEQSLTGRLLGYGTIVAGELEIGFVPEPRRVYGLVERLSA